MSGELDFKSAVEFAISRTTGRPFRTTRQERSGGGCINQGQTLVDGDGLRYFVKHNHLRHADMFAAEAEGLLELAQAGAIRVPAPVCQGVAMDQAYLVLEWLPLGGQGNMADLGHRLARLHGVTRHVHGWHRDNTIGSTLQPNPLTPDWIAFYRNHRLAHQIELARNRGAPRLLLKRGEQLLDRLADFFPGYTPIPSLLHGDLWGGNFGFADGEPVLFDPAVYFGDREADIAMTELFGGFSPAFHGAYREAWPLDAGYSSRKTLYNLYHVLNHFNLFGGGYAGQAQDMIDDLLSQCY